MSPEMTAKVVDMRDQIASVLMDTVFLCAWTLLMFATEWIFKQLRVGIGDLDLVFLGLIQFILAVSTIAVPAQHLVRDIPVLWARGRRQVKAEFRVKVCDSSSCPLATLTSGN